MSTKGKITKEVLESALRGDLGPLRSIPKTDLHAHLQLSAPFAHYQKLAGGALIEPPAHFDGLPHFLSYLRGNFFPLLRTWENQMSTTEAALNHMVNDGIIYTQLAFDVSMAPLLGISWPALIDKLGPFFDSMRGKIAIDCDFGVSRDSQPPEWMRHAEEAIDTGFFSGIDLYGDEAAREVEEFLPYINYARKRGLRIKLHTGESQSSPRVRREIEVVAPHAVQHGIGIASDPQAVEWVAQKGLPFHVCPTSNVMLRNSPSYKEHQIRALFDGGVKVTLNSDDLGIFHSSVSEEYLRLYEAGVFSAEELEEIRMNGISLSPRSFQFQ